MRGMKIQRLDKEPKRSLPRCCVTERSHRLPREADSLQYLTARRFGDKSHTIFFLPDPTFQR
jgi:hypothetical protein